jgi:molybdenum cofactor synthesis domain-containing protein
MPMGRVEAICFSEDKGTQKEPREQGILRENHGLDGDAHAGPWHRQLSLLSLCDVDWMRSRGLPNLKAGAFGENLVVEGIDLSALGLGSRLRVGKKAELSVTQHGKVCHHRCAIFYKAGQCIMPSRGLFARVRVGGPIAVGDPVEVVEVVNRENFQIVVLTLSDKGSQGQRVDTAGPAVVKSLQESLPCHVYSTEILPDERDLIVERLEHYADGHGIDLVVAVGGTGFSPRDVTPEAIRQVAERLTPGLDEAIRIASLGKTPRAMLSRAVSGIRGQTLILSLPGSERAALENLAAILPALPHGLAKLRGDSADCGQSGLLAVDGDLRKMRG